jgi:hypothetical protein
MYMPGRRRGRAKIMNDGVCCHCWLGWKSGRVTQPSCETLSSDSQFTNRLLKGTVSRLKRFCYFSSYFVCEYTSPLHQDLSLCCFVYCLLLLFLSSWRSLQSNPYWWLVVQVVVPNNNIYSNIYLNLSDEASLSPDRELFFSIFINLESNKCTVINNLSTEPRRWQRILIIFLWALNIKATFIRSRVIIETNISPPPFSKVTLCTQHRFQKSCRLLQNA